MRRPPSAQLHQIQRLDPEPVAREHAAPRRVLDEAEREHADEPVEQPLAPLLPALQQHLGVAGGAEAHPRALELRPQLLVVVDDAVEDDRQAELVVDHRLRAALGEVDDREPAMHERRPVRDHAPSPSGPRGASAALMRSSTSRSGDAWRRSSPAIPHIAQTARTVGSDRAAVKSACRARIRRPSCGADPRPARERWRAAPVAALSARIDSSSSVQPRSAACGAQTSSSSASHSRAGRRRSVSGSTKRPPCRRERR